MKYLSMHINAVNKKSIQHTIRYLAFVEVNQLSCRKIQSVQRPASIEVFSALRIFLQIPYGQKSNF